MYHQNKTPWGYFGNGTDCSETSIEDCSKICGQNSKCNNNRKPDENELCLCDDGFKWNSELKKCEDIDECLEKLDYCQGLNEFLKLNSSWKFNF